MSNLFDQFCEVCLDKSLNTQQLMRKKIKYSQVKDFINNSGTFLNENHSLRIREKYFYGNVEQPLVIIENILPKKDPATGHVLDDVVIFQAIDFEAKKMATLEILQSRYLFFANDIGQKPPLPSVSHLDLPSVAYNHFYNLMYENDVTIQPIELFKESGWANPATYSDQKTLFDLNEPFIRSWSPHNGKKQKNTAMRCVSTHSPHKREPIAWHAA